MLIMKIACGESAVTGDGIGDVHIAMLADDQFRVYVNGGLLPNGEEDRVFKLLANAAQFACDIATCIAEEFVEENPL